MRRKLSLVVALSTALTLIGYAPTADANHSIKDGKVGKHENSPSPPVPVLGGFCKIVGLIDIDDENGSGGVPRAPQVLGKNHNHFKFASIVTKCQGGPMPGDFQIYAAGATDGPGECGASGNNPAGKDEKCSLNHGEDAAAGWSHSDCYAGDCVLPKGPKDIDDIYSGTNVNEGGNDPLPRTQCNNCTEIIVDDLDDVPPDRRSCQNANLINPDNETCANFLKFCRGIYDDEAGDGHGDGLPDNTCSNLTQGGNHASTGGDNVLAWGALVDWSHDKSLVVCFFADLTLTLALNPNNPTPSTKINRYVVDSKKAFTWSAIHKDNCLGKKNPDKSP